MIDVSIEKLVQGGRGLGFSEQKPVFAWNALPGETVAVWINQKRKDHSEGIAVKILAASPARLEPKEAHFLSCSPWQILSRAEEREWKKKIALETYQRIGKLAIAEIEIVDNDVCDGYRNKMEFSFTDDDNGGLFLAFFQRGRRKKIAIKGCVLASPALADTAAKITAHLFAAGVGPADLKSLIVRSNQAGETAAALFVTDKNFGCQLPELPSSVKGFHIYYSDHRSPASIPTEKLSGFGDEYLEETVGGVVLRYGLMSFFQVNVPMFAAALADMAENIPGRGELLEYYSGVGTIGLALAEKFKKISLVDNNAEAIEYARQNIALNEKANCLAAVASAEKMTDLITSDKIVVVDPPRAGLHKDVVERLLLSKPPQIAYLSCDISTQARDLCLLAAAYKVSFLKIYNFFPRTPHIEALAILEKKL